MARLSIHPDQARNSGLQMDNVEKVIREAFGSDGSPREPDVL